MAVKIKLMRLGKIRAPHYRIVVADARTRRSGRAIETIGKYHPKGDPSFIEVDSERAQYWLGVGAQPTDPVRNILEITGDWQKFKGLPGAEGTLRHPAPPVDKLERFNAALAEAGGESTADATTPKKKSEGKARTESDSADKGSADKGSADKGSADKGEPKAEKAVATSGPKAEKAEAKVESKADAESDAAESGDAAAVGGQ